MISTIKFSGGQSKVSTEGEALDNKEVVALDDSTTKYPSNKVVKDANTTVLNSAKSYADNLVVAVIKDRGNYNPTITNDYPTTGGSGPGGALRVGDQWQITGVGIGLHAPMGGAQVSDGDTVRVLVEPPGQIASNWVITEINIEYTPENQAFKVGTILGTETDVREYPNLPGILSYFSTAKIKSLLGITTLSGPNTGDQDLSGLVTKTTTVNGKPLSGNISLTADDVNTFTQFEINSKDGVILESAKVYADSLVVGLVDDRGNYNPSTNSNQYPTTGGSGIVGAILKGDLWTVSGLGLNVVGTIGSKSVTDGDLVRALSNTPGQTASNWAVTSNYLGYVAESASNKVTTLTGNEADDTKYGSVKAVVDWVTSLFVPKTRTINGQALTANITLSKTDVGLGNVDNTSDINKPVSTAQATAIGLKENSTNKVTSIVGNESNTALFATLVSSLNYFQQKLTGTIFGTFFTTLLTPTAFQPVDADELGFNEVSSGVFKKITFTRFKAFLSSYYDSRYVKMIYNSNGMSVVTGTTTETTVATFNLPANTVIEGKPFEFMAFLERANNNGSFTFRLRTSAINVLPTGTTGLLFIYTSSNGQNFWVGLRNLILKSNQLRVYTNTVTNAITDYLLDNTAATTQAFDPTVINYFWITIQNSSTTGSTQVMGTKLLN